MHTYYKIISREDVWSDVKDTLLSFQGSFLEVECQSDVEIVGRMLRMDPSRKSEKHIMQVCYPGDAAGPIITARKVGKGRVVYIAADLDAACRRYGDKNTIDCLTGAVLYAGKGAVPLKTNTPPSVEIVAHTSDKNTAVLLLNHTSNQYMADPIRYIVPISDVTVEIQLAQKPKKVSSLSGQNLKAEYKNGWLNVNMAKLTEYDGILVDF